jgi:hypothetical protein
MVGSGSYHKSAIDLSPLERTLCHRSQFETVKTLASGFGLLKYYNADPFVDFLGTVFQDDHR